MATNHRQLYACVFDSECVSRIYAVAQELNSELTCKDRIEDLLHSPTLEQADAILVEFPQFSSEAFQFVESCRERVPDIPILVVLSQASANDAARFTRCGVFECLDISSTTDEIFNAFELAYAQITRTRALSASLHLEPWRRQLVGESLPLEQITKVIRLVASRRCTVLISGETGTGKELAARAIHMASDRARRSLVSINCSAIPENLIEAELFGHVKGAFTGAVNHRIGRFEQANGGTLFLDEIAELPFDLQAKLLRVLQEREVQRIGSSDTIKVDVRVIAATNANLLAAVQQGRFREDLYYRLNVVPMHMPALRDRISDVPLLVGYFVQKICNAEGIPVKEISTEAIGALCRYTWPGNVRQLENVVEHAVVMSGERACLYPSDFVIPRLPEPQPVTAIRIPASDMPDEGLDYTQALRQFERAILQQALSKAQGNKTLAADMLRLPRTTLIHKLRVLQEAAA
jgi:DNA-binding NtrC family response regulator